MLTSDLEEVVVDVVGVDGVAFAHMVQVLEEYVAGNILTALNDSGKLRIFEVDGVMDAALTFEIKGEGGAFDEDVAAPHGGEAVGLVVACVLGDDFYGKRVELFHSIFWRRDWLWRCKRER